MQSGTIDLKAGCGPAEVKATWIAALDGHLGWNDLPRSYRLLNAVLQALHERLVETAVRRCGTECATAVIENDDLETHLLFQRVATGFKPDRLENSQGAVVAVLDVLVLEFDEPGLARLREQLLQAAGTPYFNPAMVKWSASWMSPS